MNIYQIIKYQIIVGNMAIINYFDNEEINFVFVNGLKKTIKEVEPHIVNSIRLKGQVARIQGRLYNNADKCEGFEEFEERKVPTWNNS